MAARRVLVTGGHGFVGQSMTKALLALGHEVHAPKHLGVDGLDLRDRASIDRHMARVSPDWVVHLGAMTHLPEVMAKADIAFDINVLGTWRLLESVKDLARQAKVLVVSTCSVFGSPDASALPLSENYPRRSAHPYGVHKIALEDMAERYVADQGLNLVVARPFNHVGPGAKTRFAVGFFAREIARIESGRGQNPLRVGNLEPRRELLHVADVVAAYRALLESNSTQGVYHVASGVSVKIGDALNFMIQQARVPVEVLSDPALFRPLDAPDLRGDATKLADLCGWKPTRDWRETLLDVLEDARQRESGATSL